MNTTGIFNSQYASIPEARCQLRNAAGTVIDRCMSGARGTIREYTDLGTVDQVSAPVRFRVADDPGGINKGDIVAAKFYGDEDFTQYRVGERGKTGNVVNIELKAVHE